MADISVSAPHRTVNRFQEEQVWASGKFTVDSEGRVWRGSKRAEGKPRPYLQVKVMIKGKRYYTCAHRLVWRATFGAIPTGLCVNHKNGKKDDNRPSNLELLTYSGNTKHAYRTGLREEYGEKNPAAKVPDSRIAVIRNMYAGGGYTMKQIGDLFGVSHQHVSKIVRGQRRPKQGGPTGDYDHRERHAVAA